MNCTLCGTVAESVPGPDRRRFYRCQHCALIFVDPADHLTLDQEKEFYGTHQNSLNDARYREFLKQIIDPLKLYLKEGMRGLDYGCGPVKMMEAMLSEEKYECQSFDPIFHPQRLNGPYDFLIASEVVEHFRSAGLEWKKMTALLADGALLAIMTSLQPEDRDIRNWRYARDPTHTSFYHRETLNYLSERFEFAELYSDNRRCLVFRKD